LLPQELKHLLAGLIGLCQHGLRGLTEHLRTRQLGRFVGEIGIGDARPRSDQIVGVRFQV